MTAQQKAIRNALKNTTSVIPDKVAFRRSGAVEVRRQYFYRFGQTAEAWAAKVAAALADAGLEVHVYGRDEWRAAGPSYFCAVVTAA